MIYPTFFPFFFNNMKTRKKTIIAIMEINMKYIFGNISITFRKVIKVIVIRANISKYILENIFFLLFILRLFFVFIVIHLQFNDIIVILIC